MHACVPCPATMPLPALSALFSRQTAYSTLTTLFLVVRIGQHKLSLLQHGSPDMKRTSPLLPFQFKCVYYGDRKEKEARAFVVRLSNVYIYEENFLVTLARTD